MEALACFSARASVPEDPRIWSATPKTLSSFAGYPWLRRSLEDPPLMSVRRAAPHGMADEATGSRSLRWRRNRGKASSTLHGLKAVPELALFREPRESAPEPAPFCEPAESAPEPAPFCEPAQSARESVPGARRIHSINCSSQVVVICSIPVASYSAGPALASCSVCPALVSCSACPALAPLSVYSSGPSSTPRAWADSLSCVVCVCVILTVHSSLPVCFSPSGWFLFLVLFFY